MDHCIACADASESFSGSPCMPRIGWSCHSAPEACMQVDLACDQLLEASPGMGRGRRGRGGRFAAYKGWRRRRGRPLACTTLGT